MGNEIVLAPGTRPAEGPFSSASNCIAHSFERKTIIDMLTYRAAYQFLDDGGVHAQVLDFPSAITWGSDLAETRRLLASALRDLAQLSLERGEALPLPDPTVSDPDADLEEPIHLHLMASTSAELVPAGVVVS